MIIKHLKNIRDANIQCRIYIFGSYLYSKTWADVDFIIIYRDIKDIHKIKTIYFNLLKDYPIDLTFMSMEEEKFYNFIQQTNAKIIFP